MRVAVLWPQLSGYADAAFAALAEQGHDVLVVHRAAQPDAPFDDDAFGSYERLTWHDVPPRARVLAAVAAHAPEMVLMSSWHGITYRRVLRQHPNAVRLLGMDNQWHGTPKQWLGRATSRLYLRPLFDGALVSGEPQVRFARMLGFPRERILTGFCTADVPSFERAAEIAPRRDAFLFTGRLVPEKAVDVLAEAYRRYRATASSPWDLVVAGVGPLRQELASVPGVTTLGFVQPAQVPELMASAACLVLPSRFEPWGVVVHEAAAAGCLIVCSDQVGAATAFVRHGDNGWLVPPGDVDALARALRTASETPSPARERGSCTSHQLAAQLTPRSWAENLVEGVERLRGARTGRPDRAA